MESVIMIILRVVILTIFRVIVKVVYRIWCRQSSPRIDSFAAVHLDRICDSFTYLNDVTSTIRKAGLESCNLIFGMDFTTSNMHQGLPAFGGRNLHHWTCDFYTMEPFDEDGFIPADSVTSQPRISSINNLQSTSLLKPKMSQPPAKRRRVELTLEEMIKLITKTTSQQKPSLKVIKALKALKMFAIA
ncbi:hypothetical protein DPMN_119989 [Dreissena polymorpha]|uniref:Uncharacterized protein n=1 Tax=Dreissena polymorpha TaxID=45954 RepID=A0A9D4GN04_DREPO|nr:hypothetical protein DPMN_119989 [Dreissena polymorpha]